MLTFFLFAFQYICPLVNTIWRVVLDYLERRKLATKADMSTNVQAWEIDNEPRVVVDSQPRSSDRAEDDNNSNGNVTQSPTSSTSSGERDNDNAASPSGSHDDEHLLVRYTPERRASGESRRSHRSAFVQIEGAD